MDTLIYDWFSTVVEGLMSEIKDNLNNIVITSGK